MSFSSPLKIIFFSLLEAYKKLFSGKDLIEEIPHERMDDHLMEIVRF